MPTQIDRPIEEHTALPGAGRVFALEAQAAIGQRARRRVEQGVDRAGCTPCAGGVEAAPGEELHAQLDLDGRGGHAPEISV